MKYYMMNPKKSSSHFNLSSTNEACVSWKLGIDNVSASQQAQCHPSMKIILSLLPLVCISWVAAQTSPSFEDVSEAAGLTAEGQHHAVAIGDYNNDGWEDIYVGSKFASNALYKNNGDMTFTEVGAEAGVADEGFTNAAIWFDFDNDGDLDLATGNGFGGAILSPIGFT